MYVGMRTVATATILLIVANSKVAIGQTEVGFSGDSTVISSTLPGVIQRPRTCPTDSVWIAYEVTDGLETRLILHNLLTREERELRPPPDTSTTELGSSSNQFLEWRPVSDGSSIWAVFVNHEKAVSRLYLYDVVSGTYRSLVSKSDSGKANTIVDPSWSPDGQVIAYASDRLGDFDIYVIRGMGAFLVQPYDISKQSSPELLIGDQGDQRMPAWCPKIGAGYLAYTNIDRGASTSRIVVADPLQTKKNLKISYALGSAQPGTGYLAPSWSPDGLDIGYLTFKAGNAGWQHLEGPEVDKFSLGICHVAKSPGRDDLLLSAYVGGLTDDAAEIVDVSSSIGYRGAPAWLSGGKELLISTQQLGRRGLYSLLGVVMTQEWAGGLPREKWLRRLSSDTSKPNSPSDISVVRHTAAYTIQGQSGRMLIVNKLVQPPSHDEALLSLACENRNSRWESWSLGQAKEQAKKKSLSWLTTPIIGPRALMINRPIVLAPICTYVGLAAALHWWPFGRVATPAGGHDWSLPKPPAGAASRGTLGFVVKL